MIKNFTQLVKVQNEISASLYPLKNLGIFINSEIDFTYNFESIDYINEEVKKLSNDFFNSLTFQQKLALCLAVTEEDRNNHVDDYEIELVNKFFDVKITRDLISKMHSRFI